MIVTVEVTAEVGPVAEFDIRVAPPALNLGITVPSALPVKHDDAVNVYSVEETADTEYVHEDPDPASSKSELVAPDTATPNVTVKV